MVMNKQLQKRIIAQEVKKRGIEPDTIDLHSYIDSTLTLEENKRNIIDDLQFIVPQTTKHKSPTKDYKKLERYEKAQKLNSLRSRRSISLDNRTINKQNIPLSKLTKSNFLKWKKNKGRYDIEGIDNKIKLF